MRLPFRPAELLRRKALLIALGAGAPLAVTLFLILMLAAIVGGGISTTALSAVGTCEAPTAPSSSEPASARALAEIPADYLTIYQAAGRDIDIDWRFLASIGAQETNHGRHPTTNTVNHAGAAGPMQLGVGTGAAGDFFLVYRIDGNHDGMTDVYDPWDAIYTAAKGLRRGKGAPPRGGSYAAYKKAAGRYYGSLTASYSDEVMARAVAYGFPPEGSESGGGAESLPLSAPTAAGGISAEALDEWMKAKVPASPLLGRGQAFVDSGTRHQVDPRLLVAIALNESSLGTAGGGARIHNAFGPGPHRPYATWEAGIEAAARTLANYAKDGLVTIEQIQKRWTPVGTGNDPTSLNVNWLRGVRTSFAELGGNPDASVVGDQAGFQIPEGGTPGCQEVSLDGDPSGVRARIVAVLQQEAALGLREQGGEDRGPPLERYWGGGSFPWCAAFATWVWRRAGVPIPKHQHSSYLMTWPKQHTLWKPVGTAPPEPGDSVVYDDDNGDTDHVDIVERVLPEGKIVVVGGNVSDAVVRKPPFDPRIPQGSRRVLGFGSPVAADGSFGTAPTIAMDPA